MSTRLAIYVLAAAVLLTGSAAVAAGLVLPEEIRQKDQWAKTHLLDPQAKTPFSFIYGDHASEKLLSEWPPKAASQRLDAARTQHTITWTDTKTGLEVRCVAVDYADYPAVEWTVYFKNAGTAATPILKDIQGLDAAFARDADGEFVLHGNKGDWCVPQSYEPYRHTLTPNTTRRFAPTSGRPTNGPDGWPYYNLQMPGGGLLLAVGWPGQWAASFSRDAERGLRIRARQELTHLSLKPGEEVRTPLIVLLFWHGDDTVRAQNLWRRWMWAHNVPRTAGGSLPPPTLFGNTSLEFNEMVGANEENQKCFIDRYLEERLAIDYWWMDAGWYPCGGQWWNTGTWEPDLKRFPKGLRAISDHAHARGVKILVWFEPERVMPGTWLYQNRPQWLLRPKPAEEYENLAGLRSWTSKALGGSAPCVTYNPTQYERRMAGIRWTPGRLSFHPGPKGEYSVVRFQAPEAGQYQVQAKMLGIDRQATTDVHILAGVRSLFDGQIDMAQKKTEVQYQGRITLRKGETIDFVVGWGNGSYISDSTGLEAEIRGPSGQVFDPAKQFQPDKNPAGVWSYGWLKPGPKPDPATFSLYDQPREGADEGPRLLNLGNPEARQWLVEHTDRLLTEQGIDLYRQDFNVDPLPFWRAADGPDRQGMTENKYVQGYLAYWDALRQRRPQLIIDSCASGGRRNDLETMRRAVALHPTDYNYSHLAVKQAFHHSLFQWIPYFGSNTMPIDRVSPYAFRSGHGMAVVLGYDLRRKDLDYEQLRRLAGQWRQIAPLYYGDYRPLTPYSIGEDQWIAWQFDRPEEGDGMVEVFRREKCQDSTRAFRLGGLDPAAQYALTNLDVEGTTHASGKDLMEKGLVVEIKDRPGAAVIVYKRQR